MVCAVDLCGLFLKLQSCFFIFREDAGGAGLTHLPELVVHQLQPGDVQIVQVVAAEVRRPGAARPLRPAVGVAPRLWQQSGGKTGEFHHLVARSRDLYCALALASSRLEHDNTSRFALLSVLQRIEAGKNREPLDVGQVRNVGTQLKTVGTGPL